MKARSHLRRTTGASCRRSSADRRGTGTAPRPRPSPRSPGGVDVNLADKGRVIVQTVDLDRDTVRPGFEGPLATDRQARVEEQGCAGSGPRLCNLLRRQHTEREPSGDELGRQFVGDTDAALPHIVESDLTDVGDAVQLSMVVLYKREQITTGARRTGYSFENWMVCRENTFTLPNRVLVLPFPYQENSRGASAVFPEWPPKIQ